MAAAGNEDRWNCWVNRSFPDFKIIHDVCNGSKHFLAHSDDAVRHTLKAGIGSPLFAYGVGPLGYGIGGFFVEVDAGRIVLVFDLAVQVRDF